MVVTKSKVWLSILLLQYSYIVCQNRIDVAHLNVKLSMGETKDYFYAFEKGDTIVLNFKMMKGKHFKNVEVYDSNKSKKFSKFNASAISSKKIYALKRGVYQFRFYSEGLFNRVADVNIQRIPANNQLKHFNTNWKWKKKIDTSLVHYTVDSLIGYKMISFKEEVRELKRKEIKEIKIIDKVQRVHSFYNKHRSKTYLKIDLPELTNDQFTEENLIAWSYWIGVGQESKKAYDDNVKAVEKLISNAANTYFQTPLAGIALGAISNLTVPSTGEDVEYYFVRGFNNISNFLNGNQFYLFDRGKGISAYGRNDKQKSGTFYIGLSNDNLTRGIDVNVKIIAVKEIKIYKNIIYDRTRKEPEYLTLDKTRLKLTETKIRVPVD
ncbi:hypothetical protein [Tenacibaculum sp. 190524A05c]|uniref:hypothetical protein n=1 Tax=Tenacibaculum platacis TaxID=3137852 RepID=UPI0032B27F34